MPHWIKKAYNMTLHNLELVPDCFKTQEINNDAVPIEQCSLTFVPDYFKTEDICKRTVS